MIFGDWLGRRAQLTPNKIALVDTLHDHRPITYREWSLAVNQTAWFLVQQLGVQKGDRVAVLAHNCVEYLDIWFALGRIGGILQNLNWRLTPHELEGLIADAEPVALIYSQEFQGQVTQLRQLIPSVRHLVTIDNKAAPGARDADDAMADARCAFDWNRQFELALDGDTARRRYEETRELSGAGESDFCSMCGRDFCALRTSQRLSDDKS